MKNVLFIGFWCFTAFTLWSQQADTLNRSDENGKQGHWIFYGADCPESGIPFEGKVEEGNFVNGRKEGIWIKYHNDGVTPKHQTHFVRNRPIGAFKTYYADGNLKETGKMNLNSYRDSLIRYYQNGKVQFAAWFDSIGKEHGIVKYLLQDGTTELEYVSAHGMIIPSSVKKLNKPKEEKVLMPIEDHENAPFVGQKPRTHKIKWNMNGQNTVYTEDDKIWQEGEFKNGKLWNGKLYVYDRQGTLLKVKLFKNGIYHSEGQL